MIKLTNLYEYIIEPMIKFTPIIIIIIVLILILIFCQTNLTIQASNLSYYSLLLLLAIQLCVFCYGLIHKQIYMLVIPGLMLLGLVYTLYIKQIYVKESEIIQELKEKDIIKETNIIC
jgi:Ca2+/Na+ antiporter